MRMNEAFVKDAQNDVDDDNGHDEQQETVPVTEDWKTCAEP